MIMKNSYYNTPRKSDDCTYHSWADPIHLDDNHARFDVDDIVLTVSLVCIIVVAALAFAGII